MNDQKCLDPKGLAGYLGVNLNRAYELMRSEKFPSVKISERRWIVLVSSLEKWLEKQAQIRHGV